MKQEKDVGNMQRADLVVLSFLFVCVRFFIFIFGFRRLCIGLHCLQGRSRHLPAPHGGTVPEEALPQGIVPHRGTSRVLLDAQGTQQR